MNWYRKTIASSFVDSVMCPVSSGGYLVLLVGGKRYEYSGVNGTGICSRIDRLKKMKNKMEAGRQIGSILQNLEQFRWK